MIKVIVKTIVKLVIMIMRCKVSFSFVGSDSCYLYFYEFIKPDLGDSNITMNVSNTKIMTLDIYWTGYNSSYMPNIEKFTITGFRDFILEQARGLFKIDLNALNLDIGVSYVNQGCSSICYMHE